MPTTPKPHGNQRGPALRVRLNGGPFVDPATLAIMSSWNAAGVSYGVQIDRCVSHAVASGYSPVSDTITRPAVVTTKKPAARIAPNSGLRWAKAAKPSLSTPAAR
jgi:hypothetical protein